MSVCDDVISFATNLHVDECEAILCTKKIITVRITDSEIAEVKQNFEKSLGVRLVHQKKIAGIRSNTLEPRILVEKALNSTKNLTKREFWASFPGETETTPVENTNDVKLWELDPTYAAEIASEMVESATPRITNSISGSLNIVCEEFEIENTSGLHKSEKSSYISAVINVDSQQGSFPVSGFGQAGARTLNDFDGKKVGAKAAQMCVDSINPQICDAGKIDVILEPMAVGELLAFVFAPNFSLKVFSESKSCFSQQIGKQIAPHEFTLFDDPHKPGGLGSKSFDDEGLPTKMTDFVKNGVFVGTYSDLYNAFKQKTQTTSNACRIGSPLGRSAEPIPIAAPHNLTIKPQKMSRDELIRETKNGLLVSRLWYTYAVNPIRGDFSCTARSGIWVIRDGMISAPARPVRIIHNLPLFLQNISHIANNSQTVLPWASIPVTSPSIKCREIFVSPI